MANELQFVGRVSQTGLTVTAQVYDQAGAQVGSDVACSEVGSSAIYQGDMPTAALGSYAVVFVSAGERISFGRIVWDGAQEVTGNDVVAAIPTPPTAAEIYTEFTSGSNEDVFKADVSSLATSAEITAQTATLNAEHDATQAAIAALPAPLTAAQVNAEVDTALADYDAPTKAELDASEAAILAALPTLVEMEGSAVLTAVADVSGLATASQLTAAESNIVGALPPAPPSAAAIYAEFTSGNNEDVFKADVSGLTVDLQPVLNAISALNDFNPVSDTVARVTLVDQVTQNADMRGTDGANTIAPDNATIASILADTNELQANQLNFATATGFATPSDLTGLATSAEIASLLSTVAAEHVSTRSTVTANGSSATSDAVWAEQIEGTFTATELLRLISAVLLGKVTLVGSTYTFRDTEDTKDRVIAETDADGQRITVTKDAT